MKKTYVRREFHKHPIFWRLIAVGLVVVGLPKMAAIVVWRERHDIWGQYKEYVSVAFRPWTDDKEEEGK